METPVVTSPFRCEKCRLEWDIKEPIGLIHNLKIWPRVRELKSCDGCERAYAHYLHKLHETYDIQSIRGFSNAEEYRYKDTEVESYSMDLPMSGDDSTSGCTSIGQMIRRLYSWATRSRTSATL